MEFPENFLYSLQYKVFTKTRCIMSVVQKISSFKYNVYNRMHDVIIMHSFPYFPQFFKPLFSAKQQFLTYMELFLYCYSFPRNVDKYSRQVCIEMINCLFLRGYGKLFLIYIVKVTKRKGKSIAQNDSDSFCIPDILRFC